MLAATHGTHIKGDSTTSGFILSFLKIQSSASRMRISQRDFSEALSVPEVDVNRTFSAEGEEKDAEFLMWCNGKSKRDCARRTTVKRERERERERDR